MKRVVVEIRGGVAVAAYADFEVELKIVDWDDIEVGGQSTGLMQAIPESDMPRETRSYLTVLSRP